MLKPRALRTVARYVEHFERIDTTQGKERREVWIVFRDEGESLHHLLYTDDATTEDGPTTEGDDDGEAVSSTVNVGARAGEGAGAGARVRVRMRGAGELHREDLRVAHSHTS